MAQLIKIHPEHPSKRHIAQVAQILKNGGLVIYPTDTVYAVGCDISNSRALERLARLKGIRLDKTHFSFMCADLSNLSNYVKQIETPLFKILKTYLPGPYTFILPGNNQLPAEFKKKKTVGIRIPDNRIAIEMVKALGTPIVCTSIHNEDGFLDYITDPEEIYEKWHKLVEAVVDGGPGGHIPSTVVNLCTDPPEILRQGKGHID